MRPRGRPRAYDSDQALADARDVFWRSGYAGTSLDQLSAATGMNRPSLYGAFGDKHALYLTTLERYIEAGRLAMVQALDEDLPLPQALLRVYEGALAWYLPADGAQLGCFMIGTAAVEAVDDAEVRAALAEGLRTYDRTFEKRFRLAQGKGELQEDAEPALLAKVASAILHSLALRARAGDSRASLRATATAGVALICGSAEALRRPASQAATKRRVR
ncbi:TetR/AcrR family transcriptional regulator [Paraburkholderia lacunae]|uniref:TetR/AcrR family transcriptional regulator n=1 Tax=Paraburkholderia lacunae TaxID=2211104 RepID=UPI001FCAA767|nr:TetR/AcrR family transcriptional regulator [Paraburkholderia lacunae]